MKRSLVIPEELKLSAKQKFFVEVWHSMTHKNSLDSYRVRCLNVRIAIREYLYELARGIFNENEEKAILSELQEMFSQDVVMTKYLKSHLQLITTRLTKEVKKSKDERQNHETAIILSDCLNILNEKYFGYLLDELLNHLDTLEESHIHQLLSNYLADLVDRGWSLHSLYNSHNSFIVPSGGAFQDRLRHIGEAHKRASIDFRVIFKLSGVSKLTAINEFAQFGFREQIEYAGGNSEIKGFLTGGMSTFYAEHRINGPEAYAAAFNSRDKLESLLDLCRFGLEGKLIVIDRTCFVERIHDSRGQLVSLIPIIPNPQSYRNVTNFITFAKRFDDVHQKEHIAHDSKERLTAALNRYRQGAEAENLEMKFVSWWFGLELLSNLKLGGFGKEVADNVSAVLSLKYPEKILRDLTYDINGLRPDLTSFGIVRMLTMADTARMLSEADAERDKFIAMLRSSPLIFFRAQSVSKWLSDGKTASNQLKTHCNHIRWQILRLWRIRCCIVHKSPIQFDLDLFVANLEYYFTELLQLQLHVFNQQDNVHNREDFFTRATLKWNIMHDALNEKEVKPLDILPLAFNLNLP